MDWLIAAADLRFQQADDLEKTRPEVVNVLRKLNRNPTLEEQRRIAKIIKAALDEY